MKYLKLLLTLLIFALAAHSFNILLSQSNELKCLEFLEPDIGYVFGENGTIGYTTDGGLSWESRVSGTTNTLNKCFLLTDFDYIVVGMNGTILKTTDSGITWITKESGTEADLYGISFGGRDDEVGFAVGANGVILRSLDQGESWSLFDTTTNDFTFRSVSFCDANNGMIVGNNRIILITKDGGISWDLMRSYIPMCDFRFGNMLSEDLFYAVGTFGTVLISTNGGESFLKQYTHTNDTLTRIRFVDDQTATAVGTNGTIIRTTNGGHTWTTQSSGSSMDLNCLFVMDLDIAITGGEGGILLKTTDTGLNWIDITPTFSRPSSTPQLADIEIVPDEFSNYPNPSNPVTTIKYSVSQMSNVTLEVFDVSGRMIKTLVNETKSKGSYSVQFDGSGMASGIYFCKLVSANSSSVSKKTLRIVLVK